MISLRAVVISVAVLFEVLQAFLEVYIRYQETERQNLDIFVS